MLNIIESPCLFVSLCLFVVFGFMLKTWCACAVAVASVIVWFYVFVVVVFVFMWSGGFIWILWSNGFVWTK